MGPLLKSGRIVLLSHSAKGTTWDEHKYIKRINGIYYYPDNYEGGRHLPSNQDNSERDSSNLSENDIETLAREVILGKYGNGQTRKDLLVEYYQQIQNRVNEILNGSSGKSTKVSEIPEEVVEQGTAIIKKAVSTSKKKGLDLDVILSVYRKR